MTELHAKKPPPIYISIGPQCAGKTTFLSQLQQRLSKDPTKRITDITMDDQDGVYVRVDTKYFLNKNKQSDRFLNRRFIGKTIKSRIAEQTELSVILQRLDGRLTKSEFETSMMRLYTNHAREAFQRKNSNVNMTTTTFQPDDDYIRIAHELMEVVQDVVVTTDDASSTLPPTIDLFCVEALFRPNPKTNMTGVDAAAATLKRLAGTTAEPLAWGNTNTRPREYKNALSAAAASGRQVYFIAYGDASRVSNGVFLPVLEFRELLRRNVQRLMDCGKYVPAKGMWDTTQRVESFMQSVMRDLDKSVANLDDDDGGDVLIPIHSKLDFDKKLTQMANFEMMDDRTVRFVAPRKKNNSTTRRKQSNNMGRPPTQLRAWHDVPQQQSALRHQAVPWNQQVNPWKQQQTGAWGHQSK